MADSIRLTPTKAKDVLFSGVVISYDDVKQCGWIQSDLITEIFEGDCYIHKNVLASSDIQVGEGIRFGIHLNNQGKPQASKPVFKIGENGEAIGIENEGKEFLFAEEEVELDPQFLYQYQVAINMKSKLQNAKRDASGPYGNGKASGKSKGDAKGASKGYGASKGGGYGKSSAPEDGTRLTPTKAKDVLFGGVVMQYDEVKQCGWIQSDLITELFEGDCYIHKDVLAYADCQVGDGIRFGIHLNRNQKPQASKPVFKIAKNGAAIGIEKEGKEFMFAEEELELDPQFIYRYLEAINVKSELQNLKNSGYGKESGKSKGDAKGASKGYGSYGASDGGKGGPKGGVTSPGGKGGGIDLKIDGIPGGVSHREIAHIFRQYAGFMSLRTADKGTHTLAFATFETTEQADFIMSALRGYVFDDQAPKWEQTTLSLQYSTQPKGAAKGKW